MRVPLEWLRTYCATKVCANELRLRLTQSGTEVVGISRYGPETSDGLVVGHVLQVDALETSHVCKIDAGAQGVLTVVCGAPNVAAGQAVPIALPGATLPDGRIISSEELHGVRSEAMVLAASELEWATASSEIIVLGPTKGPPAAGTPLDQLATLSGEVLEFDITPNRSDCLGVYGLAREIHAATGDPLAREPWTGDVGTLGPLADGLAVDVAAHDLCHRFTARVFDEVKISPSPFWLQLRLMASGLRPVNNVVDISNYVMLLTGCPLHAFDLDRIEGGRLRVREARDGEKLETIDGDERELHDGDLVIADDEGITSLAGIMGGLRSEIGESTVRVALEVATWDAPRIARTRTRLGLQTDAALRYSRRVAPEQVMNAQIAATRLLAGLTQAQIRPGTIDIGHVRRPLPTLQVRTHEVSRVMGVTVDRARQKRTLLALGFDVSDADEDTLDVTVPAIRREDVTREIDLIEEVGRFELASLPTRLPRERPPGRLSEPQRLRRRAVDALVGVGLQEVLGRSLLDPDKLKQLRLSPKDARLDAVHVVNPMSRLRSHMRTMVLPALLEIAEFNARAHGLPLRLFELANVQRRASGEPLPQQHRFLGVLVDGPILKSSWADELPRLNEQPGNQVFAAKGVLEALALAVRVPLTVVEADEPEPFLHPGRCGWVDADGTRVGWIGEIHPTVAAAWFLPPVAAFELDIDRVLDLAPSELRFDARPLTRLTRRDLSIVVDDAVPAATVVALVDRHTDHAEVCSLFTGQQLGAGRKSVTVRCTYLDGASEEDVTDAEKRIRAAISARGWALRE